MKMFLISDCHGNIPGLLRAMERQGLIDKHGNRQEPRKNQIFLVGDGANCVENSWMGDLAVLDMVGEQIDGLLIGNHEFPYLDPGNSFGGFKWIPEVHHKIQSLFVADLIGPCILFDQTLISHAGVSKHFVSVEEQNNAKYFCDRIEGEWNARNWEHAFFSSVGWHRGGNSKVGGILWCDFDKEFVPTAFPQIVGHTPRCVRMKGNALCIDVGAKDQETEPFILELS